jgi:hypothetical protein
VPQGQQQQQKQQKQQQQQQIQQQRMCHQGVARGALTRLGGYGSAPAQKAVWAVAAAAAVLLQQQQQSGLCAVLLICGLLMLSAILC